MASGDPNIVSVPFVFIPYGVKPTPEMQRKIDSFVKPMTIPVVWHNPPKRSASSESAADRAHQDAGQLAPDSPREGIGASNAQIGARISAAVALGTATLAGLDPYLQSNGTVGLQDEALRGEKLAELVRTSLRWLPAELPEILAPEILLPLGMAEAAALVAWGYTHHSELLSDTVSDGIPLLSPWAPPQSHAAEQSKPTAPPPPQLDTGALNPGIDPPVPAAVPPEPLAEPPPPPVPPPPNKNLLEAWLEVLSL